MKSVSENRVILGFDKKDRYKGLKKALKLQPDEIIQIIQDSGLRGRGGAGFPTGLKWSFIPKDKNLPKYLVCNADEGEPGTFKDREIMEKVPELLIEGIIISAYAIGAKNSFIYLRKEYPDSKKKLEETIEKAYKKGYLGKRTTDIDIVVGAGAYICGEETALLESMEGKKGWPRFKPPFPATQGLYGLPTVINNVETLACVPLIVKNGADWFKSLGTEKSSGTKIWTVSGCVKKPGVYEFEMGKLTLRQLIFDVAGGIPRESGWKFLGVFPGGISTPPLKEDELDVKLDFESLVEKGTMLGSGGVIVFGAKENEPLELVKINRRAIEFFRNESCGKCTPCREGTQWMFNILKNIEEKNLGQDGIYLLRDVADMVRGKCFCPLGESAAWIQQEFIKKYQDLFNEYIKDIQSKIKIGSFQTLGEGLTE